MIPDFQTLMLPVLQSCKSGEVKISNVVEKLSDDFELLPEERAHMLPSGKQTMFTNRVHWAKSYLGKAALVELTGRGRFQITERGKEVLSHSPNRIDIKFLMQFAEFQKFRAISDEENETNDGGSIKKGPLVDEDAESLTPDEVMRKAHGELESSLASDLLQKLRSGTPKFFERAVIVVLDKMGYGGSSVVNLEKALVGGSGDGGIDGVIDQDKLGLDRIYVQAKRYAEDNLVAPAAIREFFGSLDMKKASKGIFVTSSDYSSQAKETAEKLGKRIVLINGEHLARLMIRYHVGCRVQEKLEIMEFDEEFFE